MLALIEPFVHTAATCQTESVRNAVLENVLRAAPSGFLMSLSKSLVERAAEHKLPRQNRHLLYEAADFLDERIRGEAQLQQAPPSPIQLPAPAVSSGNSRKKKKKKSEKEDGENVKSADAAVEDSGAQKMPGAMSPLMLPRPAVPIEGKSSKKRKSNSAEMSATPKSKRRKDAAADDGPQEGEAAVAPKAMKAMKKLK
eukprot:gnl/MRDRNA2_/MRDRNA2_31038_c0_seq2.p1 gnl/MRDRNA2_/MRDRNA2_31038_c0~~gnl/MRDRNA2_/MRDRNA2_31038_c0_seq2.p1  ORF type:complete len:198 (-),score=64.94 gnl/MRDRNA2_/MRDRNA2_31038_c0_seq2:58-651(-)